MKWFVAFVSLLGFSQVSAGNPPLPSDCEPQGRAWSWVRYTKISGRSTVVASGFASVGVNLTAKTTKPTG